MKNPCPLCAKRKSQRRCKLQNNTDICSLCCAQTRNVACTGCSYYTDAQQYHAIRNTSANLPDGHFMIELNPELENAVDAALALAESGKTNAAWMALTSLRAKHPDNHLVCYAVGTLHAISGDLKEAIKWFDKSISVYPFFVEAYFNKAVSHQKLYDVSNAVRAYRKVLELGAPKDASTNHAKAFLDDMAAAILKNEGITLNTYIESQTEFDRAFQLMEQNDWSAALAGFQASVAKHDRNPAAHGNMGLCLAQLGHKAQALAEFDRALELDPEYLPATTNREVAERMEEGVPLRVAEVKIVEFAKEQVMARLELKQ